MNGKPGDHPITDIVCHNLSVFGEPTDSHIRKLSKLMDHHRLCDWFERLPADKPEVVSRAVEQKLAAMTKHAEDSGWEVAD